MQDDLDALLTALYVKIDDDLESRPTTMTDPAGTGRSSGADQESGNHAQRCGGMAISTSASARA
ncbi:hypothetical protein ACIF6L_34095 [Kitasatospora sp. NPDC086009]|uniref:hypothetical protein n=1 Tax=unclassified Kitasatospora TaxID=2633591 RepID=UPI0037C92B7F